MSVRKLGQVINGASTLSVRAQCAKLTSVSECFATATREDMVVCEIRRGEQPLRLSVFKDEVAANMASKAARAAFASARDRV